MDATRPIHALPPEPQTIPSDPERDARIREEMERHMLRALRGGADHRLAQHYEWFLLGGRP